MHLKSVAVVLGVALGMATTPASAACKRLGFEVNDFGKEGPTRDAKSLLDKYIAEWTKERNIKKYSVGKKDVNCELYLNLIVVDEHTCKATATVCWEGADPSAPAPAASKYAPKAKPKPKAAAAQ